MRMNLAHIDVNLLVALDVLLEEMHVTRAARRLGITQSAMSQTLQRARDAFEDPLLVRQGRRMSPSPFAVVLRPRLREALRALERALVRRGAFDPTTAEHTFRIALFDVYATSLLPRLVSSMQSLAPRATLVVQSVSMTDVAKRLRDGQLDLAVLGPREMPTDIITEIVLEESMVSIVREGHPLLERRRPTRRDVLRWPHVVVSIADEGPTAVDHALATRGDVRRVGVRVPFFQSMPAIVAATDLIATVPRSAAAIFRDHWPVISFVSPLGALRYPVRSAWSRHLDAEPAHQWLRACIREAASSLAA